MGSSGMKRKGRQHLPKVGTRPANEHELHDRRELAMHPFHGDPVAPPRGPGRYLTAAVVVILVIIAIVALALAF